VFQSSNRIQQNLTETPLLDSNTNHASYLVTFFITNRFVLDGQYEMRHNDMIHDRFTIHLEVAQNCFDQRVDLNVTMTNVIGMTNKVVYRHVNQTEITVWGSNQQQGSFIATVLIDKQYTLDRREANCSVSVSRGVSYFDDYYPLTHDEKGLGQYHLYEYQGSEHIFIDLMRPRNLTWESVKDVCKRKNAVPFAFRNTMDLETVSQELLERFLKGVPILVFTGFVKELQVLYAKLLLTWEL